MAKVYRREDPIEPEETGSEARVRRSRAAELLRLLTVYVIVLLVLLLGVIIFVQTEWGRVVVEGIAVGELRALLEEDAELDVRRIDGNFLTGARMLDVVVREGNERVIEMDTLVVRYNLLTLFRRTFSASSLSVSGLRVWARQDADTTWNVGRILRPVEPRPEVDPYTVRVGEASLRRGLLEMHYYHPHRDSVLVADPIHFDARDFKSDAEGVRVRFDTLLTTVTPAVIDPVPIDAAFAGNIEPGQALIDGLILTSARSAVRAAGRIGWEEEFFFDADLIGEPLALADVRQFIALPLYGTAEVRLQSSGTADRILARLAADFEGHGSLDLAGTIHTGRVGHVRYDIAGNLTEFDPGQFLDNPDWAGSINADVEVDVGGPSLQTLDGRVDLVLRGSEFAEQRIIRADLDGRFVTGRLQFTLGAAVPGARVLAQGSTRPFDDVISYDVRGEVSDLDLAALMRDPDQEVAIQSARFYIDGRGTDPQTIVADYGIAAVDARFGDLVFASARADGAIRRGVVSYDADLRLAGDGGAILGVGTAQPFDEPITYQVDSGQLINLNLAALTGNPDQDSDITGTFTLTGVGTEPQTMRLDFAANISDSRYGDLELVALTGSGTLAQAELRLDVAADLGAAGRLTAVGSARPFSEPITFDFSGRVENLDFAVLLDDPAQASDITGAYVLTGSGTDPETLTADFRIDLEPSTLRGQELIAGRIEGTMSGGVLIAQVDALTPEGQLVFTIRTQPFIDEPTLMLTEGRFAGLNLALLLDQPGLQTDLHGTIELDLTGFNLAEASGSGTIILERSRINAALLERGRVEFQLEEGTVTAVAALNFVEGEAGVAFHGRPFDDVLTYSLDARLDSLDVMALVGDRRMTSRVNAVIDITGTGTDPETMTARAEIVMTDSRVPDSFVDSLHADVALIEGVLYAHEFDLRADFGEAVAEGQIALFDTLATTNLRLHAEFNEAGPLDALTPEPLFLDAATIDGRFTGPAGGPIAFDGTVVGERVAYGQYGAQRLDARANLIFDPDDAAAYQGRVHVQFDFISLPTFNLRDGDLTIQRVGDDFSADGRLTVDERRDVGFRARFEAIDDPEGPFHTALVLDRLDIRLDEDRWQLLQPSTIAIGDLRYQVRNLALATNGQQILADGEIDFRGEQTLLLTAEDVRIDLITDLIGYRGVGGVLSATVGLEGPAEAPEIIAAVEIDDITSQGQLVGALDASFHYHDERLDVEALLTHVDGQTLVAQGHAPLVFRLDGVDADPAPDASVDLTFVAEDFPIAWARPFVPPRLLEDLAGTLTTNVHVGGTYADPVLDGQVAIADGRLALEATGDVVFQDITLVIELVGNEARLVTARATDGRGGALDVDGTITVPELAIGELDLRLVLDNFRVIDTDTYRRLTITATRGQNLRFTGTIAEPALTGNLTLVSGDIYLTEEIVGPDLEPVELTPAQIQVIEATFGVRVAEVDPGRSTFVDELDLDVSIVIERNVWLRSRQNPRLDVEFAGNVQVVKPPLQDYQLFGRIDVTRGRVELPTLAARSFGIGTIEGTYGSLVFNGPIEETVIDLRAGMEAPAGIGGGTSAIVYVIYRGRLAEDPELTLTSDPPMETSDIACVIATGRPCGEAFQGAIAEDIAIGQLGLLVQNLAGRGLGLDVVEVVRRPTGELVVTFGSYVTDRTFAAVSQPVIEGRPGVDQTAGMAPELLIEYQIVRWLLLRLERRNIGGAGGALYIQFDY